MTKGLQVQLVNNDKPWLFPVPRNTSIDDIVKMFGDKPFYGPKSIDEADSSEYGKVLDHHKKNNVRELPDHPMLEIKKKTVWRPNGKGCDVYYLLGKVTVRSLRDISDYIRFLISNGYME